MDDSKKTAKGLFEWPSASLVVARSGYGFEKESAPSPHSPPPAPSHAFDVASAERYEADGILGHGGMGKVTLAFDQRLRRNVALKEAHTATEAAERLTREACVTAQLEHPFIVPVYDGGRGPSGDLYYTMRLVRGRTLASAITACQSLDDRLSLMRHVIDACEALGYAHSLGVVHRDLKPANIMVGEFGETQVLDWGLAKPIGQGEEHGAVMAPPDTAGDLTQLGAVVGTPSYMSPEQARGEDLGPQTDVWSLGAVIYEVLTATAPYDGPSSDEIFKARRAGPPPPVSALAPDAPPELVAIVAKAMAPTPTVRYETAKGLADDLLAWLEGRRVAAYQYSAWALLRRLAGMWRAPLLVALAALTLIIAAVAIGWWNTATERERALEAEALAHAATLEANTNLAQALTSQALAAAQRGARPEAELLASHAIALADTAEARGVLARYAGAPSPSLASRSAPLPDCLGRRLSADGHKLLCVGVNQIELWTLAPVTRLWVKPWSVVDATFYGHEQLALIRGESSQNSPDLITLSLDGAKARTVATLRGGPFRLIGREGLPWILKLSGIHFEAFNPSTDEVFATQLCGESQANLHADIGPTGQVILACSDGTLKLSSLGPQMAFRTITRLDEIPGGIGTVLLSPDGKWVALGALRGETSLVDLRTGQVTALSLQETGSVSDLSFSPNGRLLAVFGIEGQVQLVEVESGLRVGTLPRGTGHRGHFSEDGKTLTTVGHHRAQWTLPDAWRPRRFKAEHGLTSANVSPDGTHLVTTDGGGFVEVRDLRDAQTLHRIQHHPQVIKGGAFSSDGSRFYIASMGYGGLWALETDGWTDAASISDPGRKYRRVGGLMGDIIWALGYGSEGVRLWQRPSHTPIELKKPTNAIYVEGASDHAQRYVALLAADGGLELIAAGSPPTLRRFGLDGEAVAVDVFPGGKEAVYARASSLHIIDTNTGQILRHWPVPTKRVLDVAVSHDGHFIATGSLEGVARVWSAEGALLATLRGHEGRVSAVQFDPDGKTLTTASWDTFVQRWGLEALSIEGDELVRSSEARWALKLGDLLGK